MADKEFKKFDGEEKAKKLTDQLVKKFVLSAQKNQMLLIIKMLQN